MGSASILLALAGMLPASVCGVSRVIEHFVSYCSVYPPSGRMPDAASNMLALPYLFDSLAQVSLNVTVLFHTCFSVVESGSSVK